MRWQRSTGTPLALPITYSTGKIVDPVPMNGGILNLNTEIGFDGQGRVLISYHRYDASGNTQVYVARRERSVWRVHQVGAWKGRWTIGGGGTVDEAVDVGPVSVLPDGNLRLDFLCQDTKGRAERTRILNPAKLRPITEFDTPRPPGEVTEGRSEFPEMRVNLADDLASGDPQPDTSCGGKVCRPDVPREPPVPGAGPLEVYLLRR